MTNVGSLDRALRIVVGAILLVVPFVPPVAAALAGMKGWIWIFPALGVVAIATGLVRFCPLYRILGLRT